VRHEVLRRSQLPIILKSIARYSVSRNTAISERPNASLATW
jgi:hypothetical protein